MEGGCHEYSRTGCVLCNRARRKCPPCPRCARQNSRNSAVAKPAVGRPQSRILNRARAPSRVTGVRVRLFPYSILSPLSSSIFCYIAPRNSHTLALPRHPSQSAAQCFFLIEAERSPASWMSRSTSTNHVCTRSNGRTACEKGAFRHSTSSHLITLCFQA